MNIPQDIIEAVKQPIVATPTPEAKVKAPKWLKESSKRILHAVGNGLRTASSISHALGVEKSKVQSNLWHLKDRGLLHGEKKQGSNEYKYYLTTDKPSLSKLDLTPKKRKYTKRATVGKTAPRVADIKLSRAKELLGKNHEEMNRMATELVRRQADVDRLLQRNGDLEVILAEKEKEVWQLECELFDKKAVITYLEGKLPFKGAGL